MQAPDDATHMLPPLRSGGGLGRGHTRLRQFRGRHLQQHVFKEISMDLQLINRRALITGSTGSLGYAIAQGLPAEGAEVVITGRSQSSVDAALARLAKTVPNAKAEGIAADSASMGGADAVF